MSVDDKSSTAFDDETFSLSVKCDGSPVSFKIIITNVPENFEGGQWRLSKLSKLFRSPEAKPQETGSIMTGKITRDSSGEAEIHVDLAINESTTQYSIIVDIFLCGTISCYKKSLKFLLQTVPHDVHDPTTKCFKYTPKNDFFI